MTVGVGGSRRSGRGAAASAIVEHVVDVVKGEGTRKR